MITLEKTIKETVVDDFRTAAVFQKYGLDFCCGGGVAIEEACRKNGLDADLVRKELEATVAEPDGADNPARWETGRLIDHIITVHHGYINSIVPVILQHAQKVAQVHGPNHPETVEVAENFVQVAGELAGHMHKEEMILFPYIRTLAEAVETGRRAPECMFGTVRNPISMMEEEHQAAGDELAGIRRMTNDYTPPEDACTTYRVLYQELKQFEDDLHTHVHLENNILFPRAVEMEDRA